MMHRLVGVDVLPFGVVSVLGLAVDLGVAWGLSVGAGVALPLAALCGFSGGAVVNYALHRSWTFRGATDASLCGGLLYGATLGATLLVRIGIVALLARFVFTRPGLEMVTFVLATGFSFSVNYLLSKHVFFRPAQDGLPSPGLQ